MTIRTIIVEDTIEGIKVLKALLREHCPNIKVVGEAYNSEEAYDLIKKEEPQLAFLDVELERGTTSFDLLKRLSDEGLKDDFNFIFFTSYEKYILKAFRLAALDFLKKPIDKNELIDAIRSVEKKIEKEHFNTKEHLRVMLELLNNTKNYNDRSIPFPTRNGKYLFLKVEDILYLQTVEVQGIKISNATKVFLQNGEDINAMNHIGSYKKLLIPDFNFFLIHQSILINLDYIKTYDSKEGSIVLKNGKTLIASREGNRKLKEYLRHNNSPETSKSNSSFKKWIEKFLKRF